MDLIHPELTPDDLAELRRLLESSLEALTTRSGDAQIEDDGRGDSADRATLEDTHQTIDRLRDVDTRRITLIHEALTRMNEGTYGFCVETEEPIARRRLFAIPEVALSVEAAESREAEAKARRNRKGLLEEFDPL
jgi:DnaK suppressor protein